MFLVTSENMELCLYMLPNHHVKTSQLLIFVIDYQDGSVMQFFINFLAEDNVFVSLKSWELGANFLLSLYLSLESLSCFSRQIVSQYLIFGEYKCNGNVSRTQACLIPLSVCED